jgi:Nitrogenase molybdenum-iron protein, alpha and beta chains
MSFEHDRPEGLLGAMLAIEGINDSMTILNGPTGCKYYPASASEAAYPQRKNGHQAFNPYRYHGEFFFSQPRIPCTFMDGNDYIMGTRGKLDKAVNATMDRSPKLIGILNSPGASLTGEDLSLNVDPKVPMIRMISPEPSVSAGKGFQDSIISILEAVRPSGREKKCSVNLLGISIWHLCWRDSIADLTKLLNACGITVNTVAGAGWSVDDIKNSGKAELNVVVHEEYGKRVAEWYSENVGIPYVCTNSPVGFDNLERWVSAVCERLGCDPSPALCEIKMKRTRAATVLSGLLSSRRPPRGMTFSVSADASLAYSVTEFLYNYLGMVPAAVNTGLERSFDERFARMFKEWELDVSDDVFNTPSDIILGDGCVIASLMQRGVASGGVDIARPGLMTMNVVERPVLGLGGTMRLLDCVLNSLEKCGQTH